MSRTDAFIYVSCDGRGCDIQEEVQLTALAGGSWDERNVEQELGRQGWVFVDGKEFCEQCVWQANDEGVTHE